MNGARIGITIRWYIPRIPRIGFAGFNHCFMHIPAFEVGTLWLCAYLRGEIRLPAIDEMEASIERIREWKRTHIQFELSRAIAVNTRFQQYIDILLKELALTPYRKLPNVLAEIFGRYGSSDYRDIVEQYNRTRSKRSLPLATLPIDT